MANQEHLDILKQGVEVWNQWRQGHPSIQPDLRETNLFYANLEGANLEGAKLSEAILSRANLQGVNLRDASLQLTNLQGADLRGADLRGADLREAYLHGAYLRGASLQEADLTDTCLIKADLLKADLSGASLIKAVLSAAYLDGAVFTKANLEGANLSGAVLIGTNLTGAILTRCSIYGISAWNVQLEGATQESLVITPEGEPTITVDNLKVAQFIYLLLSNGEIREVIDTITTKVVLILGRFTPQRKAVLDALRDELRQYNYSPVVFDFDRPSNRDFTETVRMLAHLARFIIADLTDPRSIPQELQAIVPDLEVPVVPLLEETKREYAMFVDFRKYPWVLPVYLYKDQPSLLAALKHEIIEPADKKARELALGKAKRLERP